MFCNNVIIYGVISQCHSCLSKAKQHTYYLTDFQCKSAKTNVPLSLKSNIHLICWLSKLICLLNH